MRKTPSATLFGRVPRMIAKFAITVLIGMVGVAICVYTLSSGSERAGESQRKLMIGPAGAETPAADPSPIGSPSAKPKGEPKADKTPRAPANGVTPNGFARER